MIVFCYLIKQNGQYQNCVKFDLLTDLYQNVHGEKDLSLRRQ